MISSLKISTKISHAITNTRPNFPVVSFTHTNNNTGILFLCSFLPLEILVQNHSNDNDLNLCENLHLHKASIQNKGYKKHWTGPDALELYNDDATKSFFYCLCLLVLLLFPQ